MGHKGNEKISDKLEIPCRSSHSFAYSWQICLYSSQFFSTFCAASCDQHPSYL